jgi:magnesium chelatase subunit H
MPKRISAADSVPIRVVIVTMDSHLASAAFRARQAMRAELPGLLLQVHSAAEWGEDPAALARCQADIAVGDIIVVTMLFMEEHVDAVLPALRERRDACDAMVAGMSAGEVIRLTRMGRLSMTNEAVGAIALLKRLRGSRKGGESSGRRQIKMLRQIPRLLRFIPGTAQDLPSSTGSPAPRTISLT